MDLSQTLRSHRSIRKYRPDPIPEALLNEAIEESWVGASSSGNLNCVSLILTRDPERRQRLFELHGEQPFILEAPLTVTFCADWNRTRHWLRLRGARDNFNNLMGFLVGAVDTVIVAQSLCLSLETRGLGICYMGTTLFRLREIGEFLGLPETVVPITTIVAGYPDEDPAKRDRLPLSGVVFEERYKVPSDEELLATYAEREDKGWRRYMANEELRKTAEELGIKNLAQFYTSKAKYDPEFFAECIVDIEKYLKDQGFLPRA